MTPQITTSLPDNKYLKTRKGPMHENFGLLALKINYLAKKGPHLMFVFQFGQQKNLMERGKVKNCTYLNAPTEFIILLIIDNHFYSSHFRFSYNKIIFI